MTDSDNYHLNASFEHAGENTAAADYRTGDFA